MAKLIYTRDYVDRILDERIRPYCDGKFMPSIGWFKENGLNSLYLTINRGNVAGYDNYKDFCEKNRLVPGGKNHKWNFKTVNDVFNQKVRPFCNGEFMPSTTWFPENNLATFYNAIRQGKVEGYLNYKDFCEKQGYKTAGKEYVWNFKTVNEEFQRSVKPFCVDGSLPGYRWFVRNGLGGLFVSIERGDIPEYKNIDDFCVRKGLIRQNKGLFYTKERVVKFFTENILPKLNSDIVTHQKLSSLGFLRYYNAITCGRVDGLQSIQELLNEFGLPYGREKISRGTWNKEKIDQIFRGDILPHCKNGIFPGSKWCDENGLSGWKCAVYDGKYGYENMQDFLKKNNLSSKSQNKTPKWTDKTLRCFFLEHILPHCQDGIFISRSATTKIVGGATWYDTCGSVYRRKIADEYGLLYRESGSGRPKG